MSALVGRQLDQYRLLDCIGQGRMATVHLAQENDGGEKVALKVLSPTATPAPTPVPPIASTECPGLRIYGFSTGDNDASWLLDNGTERQILLENVLDFSAPPSNQAVEAVKLDDETVFRDPAVEGLFTWIEGADRTIAAGMVERLTFTFASRAALSGYSMELLFSGECRLTGTW